MTPSLWRIALAFPLAPVLPCILVALALSAASNQWNGFPFGIAAMLVVTETLTLVVALPLYLVLRRFWTVRLVECLVAGMLVGLVPAVIGLFVPTYPGYSAGDSGGATVIDGRLTRHGVITEIKAAAFQSCMGAGIGLSFWLFGLYRPARRGRDATISPESDLS